MINLKNKKILITGATGGIGKALVKKFSLLGANILATGTKTEKLDLLKKEFANINVLKIGANSGGTAITQLDGAIAGQVVTIIITSGTNSSTIADSGNFKLSAAFNPNADDTITLYTSDGTTWYELSRSAN